MRTYTLANFKGGVSKTTTAVNLAAIWAARGDNVLLIDADPQHNATTFYGCEGETPTLADVLRGETESLWSDVLTPANRERLWLLPADMGLLELDLAAMRGHGEEMIWRLRDFLDAVAGDAEIDRVIIDCPPSFTAGSVAALSVADMVILPTTADAFAAAGVEEMLRQIRTLQGRSCRVLITMETQTRLFAESEAMLRQRFDCLATTIRRCVKVPESSFAREPLMDYAPRCTAAVDYGNLAYELATERGGAERG